MATLKIVLVRRLIMICTALLIIGVAGPAACLAGSGKATLSSQNDKLVVKVNLPSPPPVNLIAKLKLKKSMQVVSASPKAAKIDKEKSVVTWLIKKPQRSTLTFSVKTTPSAALSSASAVITYRSPGDGSLVTIQASPGN